MPITYHTPSLRAEGRAADANLNALRRGTTSLPPTSAVCQATGDRLTQDVELDVPRTAAMQRHRGRRKIMPVLKSPPRLPRSATIQVRVEEEINLRLRKYAEFIGGSPAYVVSESLRLLFNKDHEFRDWMAQHGEKESPIQPETKATASPAKSS